MQRSGRTHGRRAILVALLSAPLALAAAKTTDIAGVMPDKTLLYVGWAGLGPDGKTTIEQLRRGVAALAKEEFSGEKGRPFELLAELAGTAVQYAGGIGLFDVVPSAHEEEAQEEGAAPVRIEGAVVVAAGADSAKLADLLRQLVTLGGESKIEERTVAGVTLSYVKPPGNLVDLLWGVHKDMFLLALSEASAGDVIARLNGGSSSLADSAELKFDRAKVQADPQNTSFCVYADVAGIVTTAKRVATALKGELPPIVDQALEELGISAVRSKYVHLDRREGQERLVLFAHVQGPRRGILKIWDQTPLTDDDLKIIPKDAYWAYVTNLDLAGLWQEARRVIDRLAPDATTTVDGGLAAAQKVVGFSIPDDLLPAFGDTWALYDTPAHGGILFTGTVLVAEVKDPEALQGVLARLVQFGGTLAAQKARIELKQTQHGGHAIHYLVIGGLPSPVAPAWGFVAGRWVFALYPQTVATAMKEVDPQTRSESVLDQPDVQAARRRLPKDPNSFSYTDMKYFTRVFYALGTPFSTLFMSMLAKGNSDLDLMAFPPLPEQLAGVTNSVGTTTTDNDGILMTYIGGGSPMALGALAATSTTALGMSALLPSLARSREIAKRAVSSANLRGIAVGCRIYANDHDGKFPDSLDALVKDGTITAKQLESPRQPPGVVSYVYINGQTEESDTRNVLAYERIEGNEGTNVVFVDTHLEWMKLGDFERAVRETYRRLGRESELPAEHQPEDNGPM